MPQLSKTRLLLIPSYNTGRIVCDVVREALNVWQPVWVVIDGSNDGSGEQLLNMAAREPGLRVIILDRNQGKGAAVYHGAKIASEKGFTHVLTMDADGQHPAEWIPRMMALSSDNSEAMILGEPVFDDDAPALRVYGRKISNFWANLETLWEGIRDSLFGFRVYPVKDLLAVLHETHFARRFDFDPEVAVRIAWRGVPIINQRVPVRYLSAQEGGVSQFRYFRDNSLLTWMHLRLLSGFIFRLPVLILRKLKPR
jgi:glycosyltransferase involved in cell wall biosynthesis